MTKEQVIELARQAGASRYTNRHYPDRPTHTFTVEQLETYTKLVRNAALEEAAQACDAQADGHDDDARFENDQDYKSRYLVYAKHERRCAAVIRNLKEPTP